MRGARTTGLGLLVAGLVAGCGIPADDEPRAITQESIPDELTGQDDVDADGRTLVVDLYFTRFDGEEEWLVPIERKVPTGGSSSTPTAATVLDALLARPTEAERDVHRVVTKIPADTALASRPELDGGVLTVDLNEGINGVQGVGAPLAYGQMVCSVDGLEGIDGVRFAIEGAAIQAPTGDGSLTSDPVTCAAYADRLAAPPAGTPAPPATSGRG